MLFFQTHFQKGAVSILDLLALSLSAVQEGGNVLIETARSGELDVRNKYNEKDTYDPVTFADEESNRKIVEMFQKNFPEIAEGNIRSEEVTA